MLRLTRASAGSGKTHKLAYTYIKLFITRECEDGTVRLRNNKELRDSHSHILAITFTNKATNEMKERIVERLAGLATGNPKATYMADFTSELGVTPAEVAAVSKEALSILLYNYSDFQVQTIDSFFQTVLRTFAYEIEIDDNYQVELNDEFVTKVGIDATLSMIKEEGEGAKDIRMFANRLLTDTIDSGKKWNLFSKNSTSNKSMYGALLQFAKLTGSEQFKRIQAEMTGYLNNAGAFSGIYKQTLKIADEQLKHLHAEVKQDADYIMTAFDSLGEDVMECGNSSVVSYLKAIGQSAPDKPMTIKAPKLISTGVWSSKRKDLAMMHPDFNPLPQGLEERLQQWQEAAVRWSLYLENFHYLGVLQPILRNIDEFRQENNLIQLSDTNSILQRIINDDDTPFIYERLGYYLHHYLIDEFQDTSRMQWTNLKPLVNESLSNGHHNLIIGDAKQSIYRFRNAEPDLITSDVPTEFSHCCEVRGTTMDENANYRSLPYVIRFNNTLFSILPELLDQDEHVRRMASLYSNARQAVGKSESDGGYIELNFIDKPDEEYAAEVYSRLGDIVDELRGRGYGLNDIAFLVETHNEGSEVIRALMSHNETHAHDPGYKPIEFVSDESLRVSDSSAVRTVVSVLKRLANSKFARSNSDEPHRDVDRFCCDFNLLLNKYPDADQSDLLMRLIEETEKPEEPAATLSDLKVLALPALVEKIIARYLRPETRDAHAGYLAAFVDTVIDYCEVYPTDTSSFLKWWADNHRKITLTSPEGTDALTVMTIHKSKGLEFPCVIMPKAKANFRPSGLKAETLWVKPEFPKGVELPGGFPPYLPVLTRKELEKTPHCALYKDYCDKVKLDSLNMTYVAFTRAVRELYVFTKVTRKEKKDGTVSYDSGTNVGAYLYKIFGGEGSSRTDVEGGMSIADGEFDPETMRFTYGRKEQAPAKETIDTGGRIIKRYGVNDKLSVLHDDPDEPKVSENPAEARYGTALHAVMENVRTAADLDRAIRRAKRKHLLGNADLEAVRELLSKRITEGEARGWFNPESEVLTERHILAKGKKTRRPDRVEIRPDGSVCVIDYKFEADPEAELSEETMGNYRREVRRYMKRLQECGVAKGPTEGWLWFMHTGRTEKC